MSDQNAALAKKATEVKSPTQEELKQPPGCIRQQNEVKKTKKEVPSYENFRTVQSGYGQSYKRKIDDVIYPNLHQDRKNMSGSPALTVTATEGSLSHAKDDENKQMHVDSLNVQVSNHQSLKDSLYVIEHVGSSGKGLPYAPEDWPSPGDVWTWHVGERCTRDGFWQDRSLDPPDYLQISTDNKMSLRTRDSLAIYIMSTFPDADVDAFFTSFMWKIPCTNAAKEYLSSSEFSDKWDEDVKERFEDICTGINSMEYWCQLYCWVAKEYQRLPNEREGWIKERECQIATLNADIADIKKKHEEAKDSWAGEKETLNADLLKAKVTIEIMDGQLERAYARNGNLIKEMEQVKINVQKSSVELIEVRKQLAEAKSTIKEMESLKEKANKVVGLETDAERLTADLQN